MNIKCINLHRKPNPRTFFQGNDTQLKSRQFSFLFVWPFAIGAGLIHTLHEVYTPTICRRIKALKVLKKGMLYFQVRVFFLKIKDRNTLNTLSKTLVETAFLNIKFVHELVFLKIIARSLFALFQ